MPLVEVTDSSTNQRSTITFFDDDTIDTVRQQIGKTLQVHPDRLMILVKVERPKDYYRNPQHWEALFNRLSMTEKYIQRSAFSEYQTFTRSPATSIVWDEIDRSEWMEIPESLKPLREEFSEYMIFGVPEEISFVLPRKYEAFNIPASQYPIPDLSALVSTMYDTIRGFYCIPFTEEAENVKLIYFPFLRDTTPAILNPEEVGLLDKNTEKIEKLLALKSPKPEKVSILRTRYHIPWIETDFGKAIQARFEQIFFGLTVSENVPCITIFTSSNEVSRHKFFTKTKKESFLDLGIWNSWWNNTKPSRSRPTLVLYRGKNNQHFDRVSITSIDMVVSTYRPEGNSETMEDLVSGVQEWMKEFDSVLPFVAENDLGLERWNLQDMSLLATYSQKLESYDLRRFGCINSVFDVAGDSVFRFLRTDFSVQGVSAIEMKLLQLLKSNPNLDVREVSSELSVSIERGRELLHNILKLINEKPDILQKAIRGFPTMKFGPNTILLSSTNRMEKSLQYANILRHILSDSDEVDDVCPKRMETVKTQVFKPEEVEVADEFMDLIADFDVGESKPVDVPEEAEEEPTDKVVVKGDRKTMYNYFNARLQKFDPETYDTNNPDYKYPKKCEQKHQPIILSDEDLKRLDGTPYDPRTYDAPNMVLDNGIVICPEYWCIRDDIPLREEQLVKVDGFQKCPTCNGKVKENAKQNPQEFTVIKRDSEFKYPRLTKYKSPTNGQLMPCCYKTPETGKKEIAEDKYYILGETKIDVPPLRLSFIPKDIIDSLYLDETYESFKTQARIQSAMGGYFRIGLGRPSETLPKVLGIKTTVPSPSEKPEIVMKCSFFPTWMNLGEGDDPLKRRVDGIDRAFRKGELSIVQELEYSALTLNCDIFRISGKAFECFTKQKSEKGILVLQDVNVFTAVSLVRRTGNSLSFKSNVYDFKETTQNELKRLQASSCHSSIPSFEDAKSAMTEIGGEYSVILDPFMRGQALYIPNKVILPFQATAVDDVPKVTGFENVKPPEHSDVLKYLEIASKYSSGFVWAEDMYNGTQLVEVRLKSGLRIPIIPKEIKHEATEVVETVSSVGEKNMTFGEEETLKENYQEISYATEVFEFLLFELSKDDEIKEALKNPTRKTLEPELRKWFNKATNFVDISKPTEFVSKIRTPCGQFKKNTCSGNVCGWDGKTCRIQIKKTLQKEALFHRLLGTLVENAKIRSTVMDERVTPFFSTILYMELPHELILTDLDVKA